MSLNSFQYIPAPMAHDTFSHACYDCNSSSTSTSATSSPFSSSLSPTTFTVPQQLGMTQGPPPHSPVATPPTFISVQVPHSSATREITMEQVMNEFNNSVEEAANNLLLNVSELRRISRVFGITRWPYKTKQSLEQRSNSFDFKVDMSAAASPKQQRRRNQPQYKHTTTLTQAQTPHQAFNKDDVVAIASLSKQKKGIRKSSKMAELQHCNRKSSGVACAATANTLPTATSNIAQPTTWYNTKIRPKSSSSSKRTSKKSMVQQQEEQQKPMPVSQIQCQQQQQQQDCPMLPSFDQLMQSLAAAVMND